MKVVIINKSDETGGAAVVSRRLMEALRGIGVDARMLVVEKCTSSPFIERAASRMEMRRTFLAERLKIYIANGMNRADLFKVDTASDGVDISRHRWVREADIVCLNWVNQGMVSLEGVRRLIAAGKPVVWTMHDLWCMTGICHHPGDCRHFEKECGDCRFLGPKCGEHDLSHTVWCGKRALYGSNGIHFVAVSNWLAEKSRSSSLLKKAPLDVIPNAFPVEEFRAGAGSEDGKFRIVMGAARLDDPVKGLPILVESTRLLAKNHPELARRTILITFGNVKDPSALEGIAVEHHHSGRVSGTETLGRIYGGADCVVSTSHYETLPGTLIEGQACGAIPVSFNRGGQGDIIDHGKTGWLAEFPDGEDYLQTAAGRIVEGLVWASRQPSSIRARLRESVEKRFSAKAVAEEYMSLFHRIGAGQ